MREISWGRVFFTNPDGGTIQYSQMGLYGKLVHTLVGILIVTMLILGTVNSFAQISSDILAEV